MKELEKKFLIEKLEIDKTIVSKIDEETSKILIEGYSREYLDFMNEVTININGNFIFYNGELNIVFPCGNSIVFGKGTPRIWIGEEKNEEIERKVKRIFKLLQK